jgi:hypothetical protein
MSFDAIRICVSVTKRTTIYLVYFIISTIFFLKCELETDKSDEGHVFLAGFWIPVILMSYAEFLHCYVEGNEYVSVTL